MTKIIVELEKLKQEKEKLQKRISQIDTIISYYFGEDSAESDTHEVTANELPKGMTRMQQALKLCEEYIKAGNTARTASALLRYVESRGIKLSRQALGFALNKPYSKLFYDENMQQWRYKGD